MLSDTKPVPVLQWKKMIHKSVHSKILQNVTPSRVFSLTGRLLYCTLAPGRSRRSHVPGLVCSACTGWVKVGRDNDEWGLLQRHRFPCAANSACTQNTPTKSGKVALERSYDYWSHLMNIHEIYNRPFSIESWPVIQNRGMRRCEDCIQLCKEKICWYGLYKACETFLSDCSNMLDIVGLAWVWLGRFKSHISSSKLVFRPVSLNQAQPPRFSSIRALPGGKVKVEWSINNTFTLIPPRRNSIVHIQ